MVGGEQYVAAAVTVLTHAGLGIVRRTLAWISFFGHDLAAATCDQGIGSWEVNSRVE